MKHATSASYVFQALNAVMFTSTLDTASYVCQILGLYPCVVNDNEAQEGNAPQTCIVEDSENFRPHQQLQVLPRHI